MFSKRYTREKTPRALKNCTFTRFQGNFGWNIWWRASVRPGFSKIRSAELKVVYCWSYSKKQCKFQGYPTIQREGGRGFYIFFILPMDYIEIILLLFFFPLELSRLCPNNPIFLFEKSTFFGRNVFILFNYTFDKIRQVFLFGLFSVNSRHWW